MDYLPILLMFVFVFSLLFNYFEFNSRKKAIELVNDMGIGYNLGNTYNCCFTSEEDDSKNYEIKLWGTVLLSRKSISKIKKYGFKTIRFQVKYSNEINESENNFSEWISKIKKIIDWILNKNMFCILSIYHKKEFLETKKEKGLDEYINIWEQISRELIYYDEHLIFESNN